MRKLTVPVIEVCEASSRLMTSWKADVSMSQYLSIINERHAAGAVVDPSANAGVRS